MEIPTLKVFLRRNTTAVSYKTLFEFSVLDLKGEERLVRNSILRVGSFSHERKFGRNFTPRIVLIYDKVRHRIHYSRYVHGNGLPCEERFL